MGTIGLMMRYEQMLQSTVNGQIGRKVQYFRLIVASVIFAVILAGCNGKENFGDANIGGPVLEPEPDVSPTGPALELEVVASVRQGNDYVSARLTNISYQCGNVIARIPTTGPNRVARCPEATDSVELFIGPDVAGANRISLGTVQLPACRSAGSDGGGNCLGGADFFQVAVSDMVDPPARVRARNAGVRNRAAFLSVLDANPETEFVIEIPNTAHDAVSSAPGSGFGGSYSEFVSAWSGWVNSVRDAAGAAEAVWPANSNQAVKAAEAAMNRSRMGFYAFEHETLGTNSPDGPRLLTLKGRTLAFSDGEVIGVGFLVAARNNGTLNRDFVALDQGAAFDEEMRLVDDWFLKSLKNDGANVGMQGRVLGTLAYDLRVQELFDKTDYEFDYPQERNVYRPVSSERARLNGAAFSQSLINVPFRMKRTEVVSPELDPSVMAQLPQFYRIKMNKICVAESPDCVSIPDIEFSAGNYPRSLDPDNCDPGNTDRDSQPPIAVEDGRQRGCDDVIAKKEFAKERVADTIFSEGYIQVQILADGSIVTDADADCSPVNPETLVDATGQQEWRVGFVSRTFKKDGESSANIVLFMAGPSSLGRPSVINESVPPMPFFASEIQGRIDLSKPHMPLYRLSDDNFDKKIRAVWRDSGFQAIQYESGLGGDPTDTEKYRIAALANNGSVDGQVMCQ